jgi:hypothetical protein
LWHLVENSAPLSLIFSSLFDAEGVWKKNFSFNRTSIIMKKFIYSKHNALNHDEDDRTRLSAYPPTSSTVGYLIHRKIDHYYFLCL